MFSAASILVPIWLSVSVWLSTPRLLSAEEPDQNKTPILSRLQVELFLGRASLNPTDLNRIIDYDNSIQNFTYDMHFDYLRSHSRIQSWVKDTDGGRKKIKGAMPVGGRIRYRISDFLAVSAGFQYIQKSESRDLEFVYTRREYYQEQNEETLTYSPYEISIKGYNPFIGVHLSKSFSRLLTAEAFFQGGPLFARCGYTSYWSYAWVIQGEGYIWPTFDADGQLEEKGSGTGIALELGGRLNVPVLQGLNLFLEGGYAYQVVKSLSGTGRELRGTVPETWVGEWKTKSEVLTAPWGTLDVRFPTNFQTSGTGIEDFWLDLSGFRIKLGISMGF